MLDFVQFVKQRHGLPTAPTEDAAQNAGDSAFFRALVIVDGAGFIFTPIALYLDAEPTGSAASNAVVR